MISTNNSKIHLTERSIHGGGIHTGDTDTYRVEIHSKKGYEIWIPTMKGYTGDGDTPEIDTHGEGPSMGECYIWERSTN